MSAGLMRAWAAAALNFVPLAWLLYLRFHRQEQRDIAFWWIALAFGLGGVADTAAGLGLGWSVVSHVYPVAQSAIVVRALTDRDTALWFLALLGWLAFGSLWLWPQHPDVPLHTAAWGLTAWVAYRRPSLGLVRWSLLLAFGLALLAWYWFLLSHQSLEAWLGLQIAYGAGLYYFCKAAGQTRTPLRSL